MSHVSAVSTGEPPPSHPTVNAASAWSTGSPEGIVARALAAMDRQRDQARSVQRRAQEARREATLKRLDEERSAAWKRFAGGVAQAGVTIAAGVLQSSGRAGGDATGGTHAGGTAQAASRTTLNEAFLQGAGRLGNVGSEVAAHRDEDQAGRSERRAAREDSVASASEQARERASGFMDKAYRHLARIAEARTEARLQASRG